MTIAEAREKCKGLLARIPRDVLVIGILVLSSSASFGLGFLAGQGSGSGGAAPSSAEPSLTSLPEAAPDAAGQVVASKNGTKYYLPECAGADRIAPANKVWFASPAAALAAGYAPAVNCKGL
jgi:hypothetical protein